MNCLRTNCIKNESTCLWRQTRHSGPTYVFICPRSNIDFYMPAASNIYYRDYIERNLEGYNKFYYWEFSQPETDSENDPRTKLIHMNQKHFFLYFALIESIKSLGRCLKQGQLGCRQEHVIFVLPYARFFKGNILAVDIIWSAFRNTLTLHCTGHTVLRVSNSITNISKGVTYGAKSRKTTFIVLAAPVK